SSSRTRGPMACAAIGASPRANESRRHASRYRLWSSVFPFHGLQITTRRIGLPPALRTGSFQRAVSIHVVSAFEARHDAELDPHLAVLLAVCASAVDLHRLAHGAPP